MGSWVAPSPDSWSLSSCLAGAGHPQLLWVLPWPPTAPHPLFSAIAGTNPCSQNNGDCSQLCLPTSETSRSCMCTAGYSLKSGQQSCEGLCLSLSPPLSCPSEM